MRGVPRLTGTLVVASLVLPLSAGAGQKAMLTGSFAGAYELPAGSQPVPVSVQLGKSRALVVLGSGHAARTDVPARPEGDRVTLTLPGRPAPLSFALKLKGRSLIGTARQGATRGTASLRRATLAEDASLGTYRLGDETLGIVSYFGLRFAIVYEEGEIRQLYRSARATYAIGAGSDMRNPSAARSASAAAARRSPEP